MTLFRSCFESILGNCLRVGYHPVRGYFEVRNPRFRVTDTRIIPKTRYVTVQAKGGFHYDSSHL